MRVLAALVLTPAERSSGQTAGSFISCPRLKRSSTLTRASTAGASLLKAAPPGDGCRYRRVVVDGPSEVITRVMTRPPARVALTMAGAMPFSRGSRTRAREFVDEPHAPSAADRSRLRRPSEGLPSRRTLPGCGRRPAPWPTRPRRPALHVQHQAGLVQAGAPATVHSAGARYPPPGGRAGNEAGGRSRRPRRARSRLRL